MDAVDVADDNGGGDGAHAMMRLALALALVLLASAPAMAAVSCSLLTNGTGTSSTDATSYATSSVTLTAGRHYFAFVASRVSSGTVTVPTLSSTGDTWARANGGTNDAVATFQQLVAAYVGTGDGAGAVTIDFSGQTQLQAVWAIIECTGVDSGDPVVQAIAENTGTAMSDTLTFAAFGADDNRPIAAFAHNGNTAGSSDWTELSELHVDEGSTDTYLHVSWTDSSADTTVVHDNSPSNAVYKNVGLEIRAATPGGGSIKGSPCCGGLLN